MVDAVDDSLDLPSGSWTSRCFPVGVRSVEASPEEIHLSDRLAELRRRS